MEQDRKFVLTEKQLLQLLKSAMKLDMLESAGVDNWCGYNINRVETIQDWFPEPLEEEDIEGGEIDFHETALAILECGGYPELYDCDLPYSPI